MARRTHTSVQELDNHFGYEIVNCEAMRGREEPTEEAFKFPPIKVKSISGPRVGELVELNEDILMDPDTGGYPESFLKEYKKALYGKSKEWFLLAVKVYPHAVYFELGSSETWEMYQLSLSLTDVDYSIRYGCQPVKFKLWTFDRDGQPKSWHNVSIEFIHSGVQHVYVLEEEGVSVRKLNFGIYDKEVDVEEKIKKKAAGYYDYYDCCVDNTFRVYVREFSSEAD